MHNEARRVSKNTFTPYTIKKNRSNISEYGERKHFAKKMTLQSLAIKWVSDEIGYGLVATEYIPKGTIIYVLDPLDKIILKKDIETYPKLVQQMIDKYTYEDSKGQHILCWDSGKYMNHCCDPNTYSTGFEIEIAIRDIEPGEEVTDDYRIFSHFVDFSPLCKSKACAQKPLSTDQIRNMDEKIKEALNHWDTVPQPLAGLLSNEIRGKLENYKKNKGSYISVATQIPKPLHS